MFTGGCGLDAAESVCSDDALDRADILDLLGRLVDKSLVVAEFDESGGVRYSQLQTLWDYGRERLAESGEADAVRDRHARVLPRSQRAGSRWPSAGITGLVCRARIATELGNLRGALDWYIERRDAASALTLTTRLAWIWFHRTDFLQAVRWLDDALRVPADAPTTLRATASAFHGYCNAWITGADVAFDGAAPGGRRTARRIRSRTVG